MKFTIENVEKAFEQARIKFLNAKPYKNKAAMELLLDEELIRRLDNLSSAKDLLQHLISFDDMDWAKGKRELSAHEMVDFISAISDIETVPLWETIDDDWEGDLEFELNYLID